MKDSNGLRIKRMDIVKYIPSGEQGQVLEIGKKETCLVEFSPFEKHLVSAHNLQVEGLVLANRP